MAESLKIGDVFSGCKILHRCGKGAYGVVYLAENAINQKIVIKLVMTDGQSNREIQGVRYYMRVSGTHPNLLQISHIGEMEDGFFYVMEAADNLNTDGTEYVPATLGNMLRQGKQFPPEEAIRIIRELLHGLTALQNAKLVHRDIKPDNIIFVNGVAKLSDPGLVAEADSQVSLAGTPGFIPPEIIERVQPADIKSDFYAIGKVFYCMVTGYPPEEYPHLPTELGLEVRRQLFPILSRLCNSNPSKRFNTVDEILKNLPERLKSPTWLEKKYKTFLDWKTLNREQYRLFASIPIILLLLVIAFFCGNLYYKKQQKVKRATLQLRVINFRGINKDRHELIAFQLKTMLPDQLSSYLAKDKALKDAEKSGNWQKAVELKEGLQKQLKAAAVRLLPAIPEKNKSIQEDFAFAGKARGYLTTPLYAYLPESDRKKYEKSLAEFEKALYADWKGPRCSGEWENFQNYNYRMVFVPPGAVELDHNKKLVTIPYHFWMAKNEVSSAYFSQMTGIAPQYSPHTGTPVERVLWNDILYYCYSVTRVLQSYNTLPPGYIVRPPTEAEWEYAAKNAWLGKDRTPFAQRAVISANANNRTYPGGSKQPNKLGLNDIYGNVYEVVAPVEAPRMQHSVVIRGGSFRTQEKACYKRIENLKYQNVPYDIGLRIVIAPGDISYFEKNFFLGGATQMRSHGKVFELVGENFSCFDWKNSEQLCRLLGGRLAEVDSPDLLQKIIKQMPLAGAGWPCFIGGRKINGKWRWIDSGKEIDFDKKHLKTRFKNADYLTLKVKNWNPQDAAARSGIFLCEWDEKTYTQRNKQLFENKKLPLEALRFTIGNRRFMLIKSSMAWYTAKRFCELLGGQLACLETPEIRKEVIRKVADYSSSHILLGGYAKWDSWYWLTGQEIKENLLLEKSMIIPTKNRNFITLKNGKFYNSQFSKLFLCEWRESISSSN